MSVNNDTMEMKIHQCLALLDKHPDDAELNLKLGIYYLQCDTQKISDGVKAEYYIARGIELGCVSAKAYYHLALAVRMQGKGGCDSHFSEAIRLDPSCFQARHFLAHELLIAGDIKGARQELGLALNLAPDNQEIKNDLQDVEAILRAHKERVKISRWPAKLSDFDNLDQCIAKYLTAVTTEPKLFNRQSRICTFGSCFAGNIARVLRKFAVDAENITFGEYINSTYANLAFLRWVCGESLGAELQNRLSEIFDGPPHIYREKLAQAQLVIITLGVAPAFFARGSGDFVLPKASQINMRLFASRYHFRTTTVDENLANLKIIVRLVRLMSPTAKIVVTVSPVPLAVSFEYDSPIVADCVSKSVLRVAADLLMREKIPDVHYWPSFEIVRWIGGYRGDAFGAEDASSHHVSESTIDAIIKAFIEKFSDIDTEIKAIL